MRALLNITNKCQYTEARNKERVEVLGTGSLCIETIYFPISKWTGLLHIKGNGPYLVKY